MTRDEFRRICVKIENSYPGKEFLKTADAVNDWYEEFQNEDYEDMLEAVKAHVREIEFLPSVANIRYRLSIIKDLRYMLSNKLEQIYNLAASQYPGGGSDEAHKEFMDAVGKVADDNKIPSAQWLTNRIIERIDTGMPMVDVIRKAVANEL